MHRKDFLINWNMFCSCYPSQLKWHLSIHCISGQALVTHFLHLTYFVARMKLEGVWSEKETLALNFQLCLFIFLLTLLLTCIII